MKPIAEEHDLYRSSDPDIPRPFQQLVTEGGLAICRRCGRSEADLVEPCTPQSSEPTNG